MGLAVCHRVEKGEDGLGLGTYGLKDGRGGRIAEGILLIAQELQPMLGMAVVGKGLAQAKGQLAGEAHQDWLGR
jgi:hypothetical protein